MGRKYKFHDNSKLYFVTFTAVQWVDVFTREEYRNIIYDSWKFCQEKKGLDIYGYCMMTNHLHMIIGTETGVLADIVRDFKSFTSRHIRKCIEYLGHESRKAWMLNLFTTAGEENSRNNDFQFWQQHNHPIELANEFMALQRLDYTHNNPVKAGFVEKPEDWLHSSAADYAGVRKGRVENLIYLQ